MIFFYIIITALPTTALAKGALECKLSQHNGSQCTGALGEPLRFYLPINTNERKHLKKNDVTIINVANKKTVDIDTKYSNWSELFTYRTFQLNKTTKKDSGDYHLLTYNSDGQYLHTIYFNLEILAPVSQPNVSQMCLSPEQMNVSCSSEGDRVEFMWILDHNIVIQTRAVSTDEHHTPNVTVSLHGQLTGNLTCRVQNSVSRADTVIQLTTCKGSISHPSLVTVAVISSATTLLLTSVLLICIKYLNKTKTPVTLNEDNAEDEIVYSDVRVKPTKKTRPSTHQTAF